MLVEKVTGKRLQVWLKKRWMDMAKENIEKQVGKVEEILNERKEWWREVLTRNPTQKTRNGKKRKWLCIFLALESFSLESSYRHVTWLIIMECCHSRKIKLVWVHLSCPCVFWFSDTLFYKNVFQLSNQLYQYLTLSLMTISHNYNSNYKYNFLRKETWETFSDAGK